MRKIVPVLLASGAVVALAIVGSGAIAAAPAKKMADGWGRVASGSSSAAKAAAAAPAAPAGARHLVLYAKHLRETFVDLGKKGESTGDSDFFEESVWNAARTVRVGQDAVECRLGIRTFNCVGTLVVFKRGKIQVAGDFFADKDNVIPVVGGTGAFAGVGGQMSVADISPKWTRFDIYLTR
jgi:hypothetical protein